MSKQARIIVSSLAAVVVAITALTLPSATSSQKDPQATRSAAARNATLIAATEEVLKETSEIRQLSILRPVRSSAQSRADIERMIMKSLDEETTPAQMHATEVTLKKFGLAARDFQYRALMVVLLTEQVAGYYDPKTREFHLADWIDLDGQKPIMAHELTHALQDQHFNLRRFEHWPRGDSDAELAAHALIEGDATLAMTLYVASNPLRALALLRSLGPASVSSVELEKAPRAVRESLLFPYQEGLTWTHAMYRRGGWQEVSQAFTSLPQSTEQILHPEKYFAHEAPVKVTLPDLMTLLNGRGQGSEVRGQRSEIRGRKSEVSGFAGSADVPSALAFERASSLITYSTLPSPAADTRSPAPGAWRRIDSDVEGEWGFYLILDQFLKSPAESRRAAAGWGGDRLAVYEGPQAEVLIASVSTWDTEHDAREFFEAYVKRTELRYPNSTAGSDGLAPGDLRVLRTSEGRVAVQLNGNRVTILEGVPDTVNVGALLKLLSAS